MFLGFKYLSHKGGFGSPGNKDPILVVGDAVRQGLILMSFTENNTMGHNFETVSSSSSSSSSRV